MRFHAVRLIPHHQFHTIPYLRSALRLLPAEGIAPSLAATAAAAAAPPGAIVAPQKARPGRPASLVRRAEELRQSRIKAAMLLLYLMDKCGR